MLVEFQGLLLWYSSFILLNLVIVRYEMRLRWPVRRTKRKSGLNLES
jgi:hypothetical protein